MQAAMQALLKQSIDYAGLFPPAQLPLDVAMRNFILYRTQPESWMLSRFVCPVARLAELALLPDASDQMERPFRIAAILRGPETPDTLVESVKGDLEAIRALEARFGARVVVDTLELPLPRSATFARLSRALQAITSLMSDIRASSDFPPVTLFCECSRTADWRSEISDLALGLAELNSESLVAMRQGLNTGVSLGSNPGHPNALSLMKFGFKLRTGGLSAAAFPSTAQVAHVICACRDVGLSWKATAGLHHPLTRFDQQLGCWTYGFLNLLAAAVLASTHGLHEAQLQTILEETEIENFSVDETTFGWREVRTKAEQITAIRREALISFGSCSFDEPRDDLRELGLL